MIIGVPRVCMDRLKLLCDSIRSNVNKWIRVSNPLSPDRNAPRIVIVLLPMTFLLLFAFVVGLRGLNADVIWSDELYSLTFMGAFDHPTGSVQVFAPLGRLAPDHVPLFYVVGAIWAQFAGWSQFAMRYLSLMAGVAMISCLYGFASDTVNRGTALVSAFLMATNAYVMMYFHDVRLYSLLLLLVIAHSWLYWRLIGNTRFSISLWMLFTLSAAAMLYTHVISSVMLAALGVTHILVERRSKRTRAVIVGWVVGLALFAPYLNIVLTGSFALGGTKSAVLAPFLAGDLLLLLTNGFSIIVIPLSIYFAIRLRRNSKIHASISWLLLVTAIMSLVFTILSGMTDLFSVGRMRYFLLLWFPCMILMAYGLMAFSRSLRIVLVILAIWLSAGVSFSGSGQLRKYTTYVERTSKYPPLHLYTSHLQGKVKSDDYLVGFTESLAVNDTRHMHSYSISDYYLDAQLGIDGVFLAYKPQTLSSGARRPIHS